ncbi:TPA: AAA family ATPase, partial [Legionella pneumophila]
MKEEKRSKLVSMTIRNIGCIGNNGLEIKLDKIVCLVGKNNSGKSTILRAYELAKGSVQFNIEHDRYQLASIEQPSEIILEVHIPKNIGNVDERWKTEHDGLLIVKSIWRWEAPDFQKVRKTWDPQSQNWADDGKAGGADPVFSSRLPRPLRIGSLEDADKTQEILLNLALTPLVDLLKKEQTNNESEFAKALINVTKQINALSTSHQEHFNKIAERITSGFQNVFPNLHVRLNIATAPLTPNVPDLIKKGSGLRINDGNADTSLNQQGTGTRRALFWAMLQVHNELT